MLASDLRCEQWFDRPVGEDGAATPNLVRREETIKPAGEWFASRMLACRSRSAPPFHTTGFRMSASTHPPLHIFYRSTGGDNKKNRPPFYSKMLCLRSFLRAYAPVRGRASITTSRSTCTRSGSGLSPSCSMSVKGEGGRKPSSEPVK